VDFSPQVAQKQIGFRLYFTHTRRRSTYK